VDFESAHEKIEVDGCVLLEKAVNHLSHKLMVAHMIGHQSKRLFEQPLDLLYCVERVDAVGNLLEGRECESFNDRLVRNDCQQEVQQALGFHLVQVVQIASQHFGLHHVQQDHQTRDPKSVVDRDGC